MVSIGRINAIRRIGRVCAVVVGILTGSLVASGAAGAKAAPPKGSALFGNARISSHLDSISAGSARAFHFTSRVSGVAKTIRLNLARGRRAHAFTIGLYSNKAGRPGSLLTTGTASSPKAGSWATVRVRSVTLRAEHRYWIAVLAHRGRLYFHDRSARSCSSAVARRHRLRGLPPRWRTGSWRHSCAISAQVRGALAPKLAAPSAPPVSSPAPPAPAPAPAPGPLAPPTIVCSRNATPSTFAAQVSAATPGQAVCLATGNYGTWSGTSKAIIVAAAPGASPTMQVNFGSGATGFTMVEIGGMSGQINAGASNITIEFSAFTDSLVITGLAKANVVLNADTFENISNPGCEGQPARIHLPYGTSTPSGVTVENSTFSGGDTDGIQTGAPLIIKDNVFTDLRSSSSDCNHTDSIQGVGSTGVVVEGNLFYNDYDGAVDFDDSTSWTVTDNACYNIDRGVCISLFGDRDSVVEHNTAGPGMAALEIDTKSGNPAGQGTVFQNNVGDFTQADGSTLATDTSNLFSSAKSPNIKGSPAFVGGMSPTTWAGYELKSTSAGHAAGSDGSDAGIRASAGGPPQ
jgi:hypothetical protein